jgi:hypothetical protein
VHPRVYELAGQGFGSCYLYPMGRRTPLTEEPLGHTSDVSRPPSSASFSPPTSSTRCMWRSHRVELGSGSQHWRSPDELLDRFHLDVVPSPSVVTHHVFWHK